MSDRSDEEQKNTFDASKARLFASGAKTGGTNVDVRPWDRFDPKAKPDPKKPFSIRLNDYDRAMVKQLATWRDTSVQQVISKMIRDTTESEIEKEKRKPRAADGGGR